VPADAALISSGQSVDVHSHAYAQSGVAEVLLSVNGDPVRRDPPESPGATFAASTQTWMPEGPGKYTLEVVAYDTQGVASAPAVTHVQVMEPPTPTPSPTATLTPTATPLPTPTPTSTAIPRAQASFWADDTSLTSGDCTLLHWEVVSATGVSLDGASVPPQGSRKVCPTQTTTYRLHVTAPPGDVDKTVAVTVTVPADTTGPSLSGVSNAPALIWDGASCGPTSATISARVSDPSGVSQVVLHYRVVRSPKAGVWRTLNMSAGGGDTFQATLGPAQLSASLTNYGGRQVEYYVVAADSKGNTSRSGAHTFEAKLCFG
jgi:hypothetical protein